MSLLWDVLYVVGAIAFSSLGGGAIVLALSSWIGKVWANKILESDRARYQKEIEELRAKYRHEVDEQLELLRDRLEKGQFVHRLQFETEFKIYCELWERLSKVRNAALRLRPVLEMMPHGKTIPEEKRDRYAHLAETFDPFQEIVVGHEPFYSPAVFQLVRELSKVISNQAFDYAQQEPNRERYWKRAEENAGKIVDYSDKVCAAIRERIGSISALPE